MYRNEGDFASKALRHALGALRLAASRHHKGPGVHIGKGNSPSILELQEIHVSLKELSPVFLDLVELCAGQRT